MSIRLQAPEFELSVTDAKRLEKAIKDVQKHYPINVSQKHLDLAALAWVVAEIYGTKTFAVIARKKTEGKSPKAQTSADTLIPFPTVSR